MKDKEPTAANIKQARKNARLSQQDAADLVHLSRSSWLAYERGVSTIKIGIWELFLFKTGQMCIKQQAPAPRRRPGRVQNLTPFVAQKAGVSQ